MKIFKSMSSRRNREEDLSGCENKLYIGEIGKEYIVKSIDTNNDLEMKNFLFTLGCFEGQEITIISKLKDNFIVNIKDARYSIDNELAKAIVI